MDYKKLLKRVKVLLPEEPSSSSRFEIPKVDIMYEGKKTILRNFGDILRMIHRDGSHMLPLLLREVGTAGEQVGDRVVLQGEIPGSLIQTRVEQYIKSYVICPVCKRPDTKISKQGRVTVLKCDACGAISPVQRRR
jgi:translation initiation factor 2 subunit 2